MKLILTTIGLLTAIVTASAAPAPKAITAQSFQLVDSKGRVIAKLEAKNDQPVLNMYGSDGQVKAAISIDEQGNGSYATVRLLGENGDTELLLTAKKNAPAIVLSTPDGTAELNLELTARQSAGRTGDSAKNTPGLELEKWSRSKNEFSTDIIGTVKNNTGHDLTFAEIVFNAYDKNKNCITTISDITTYLKSGDTWRFRAATIQEGIESVTLKSIVGHE